MPKQRRTPEEIFLQKLESSLKAAGIKEERLLQKSRIIAEKKAKKEQRLAEQAEKKRLKELAKIEKQKPKPTEEELVRRYVNRTIRNAQYHGRVSDEKYNGLGYDKPVSKNIWLDTDFYFSVVFQSKRQKLEFMEKWEQMHPAVDTDLPSKIQILNGLKLAKALGIELQLEESKPYPTGNIDLFPFIMDNYDINLD